MFGNSAVMKICSWHVTCGVVWWLRCSKFQGWRSFSVFCCPFRTVIPDVTAGSSFLCFHWEDIFNKKRCELLLWLSHFCRIDPKFGIKEMDTRCQIKGKNSAYPRRKLLVSLCRSSLSWHNLYRSCCLLPRTTLIGWELSELYWLRQFCAVEALMIKTEIVHRSCLIP